MSTRPLFVAGALAGLLTFTRMAEAQYWTMTASATTNWGAVACSADGLRVVAAVGPNRSFPLGTGGPIYISSNRGFTWTPTSAPIKLWTGLVSSADCGTLLACPNAGAPYVSTDAGGTWTAAPLVASNLAVVCSADGTRMLVSGSSGVYQSTDSGASWALVPGLPSGDCMALSAGGRILVVGQNPGSVYTFTNPGTFWQLRSIGPYSNWVSVATSADGRKLAAAASIVRFSPYPGSIFTSEDYGATWQRSVSSVTDWRAVASSADGTQLAAISAHTGFPAASYTILISTNSGATWTNTLGATFNWQGIASSADGSLKWAAPDGGPICYWQATPAPVLNIAATADTATVSWIVPSGNFGLQENPDLTPGNWSDVSVLPTLDYDTLEYSVSLPLEPGAAFFRLIGR